MLLHKQPKAGEAPQYTPTYLEAPDDIRQAVQKIRHRSSAGSLAVREENPSDDAIPYRPMLRPATSLLCVIDDGAKDEGEWFRLRNDRIVLGRSEGDIKVPHDGLMSSKHAELIRERTAQGFRWCLVDLNSTNGTFIRVSKTELHHRNEFLIGKGRYRFESPLGDAPTVALPENHESAGTINWQGGPVSILVPSLVELVKGKDSGARFLLSDPEYWIGRDSQFCKIPRANDNFVSPRHAKLFRDAKCTWHIENNKALNGVWLKVDRIQIPNSCQFQLGEQRFLLKVQG